jgi:hypothetical protein
MGLRNRCDNASEQECLNVSGRIQPVFAYFEVEQVRRDARRSDSQSQVR